VNFANGQTDKTLVPYMWKMVQICEMYVQFVEMYVRQLVVFRYSIEYVALNNGCEAECESYE
jgi:hypothetical protein